MPGVKHRSVHLALIRPVAQRCTWVSLSLAFVSPLLSSNRAAQSIDRKLSSRCWQSSGFLANSSFLTMSVIAGNQALARGSRLYALKLRPNRPSISSRGRWKDNCCEGRLL